MLRRQGDNRNFSMSLYLFRRFVREWVLVTLILLPLTGCCHWAGWFPWTI